MITLHADPGADSGGNGTTSALSSGDGTHAYQGIDPAFVALKASGPNARGDDVTLKLWNQTGIADTDPGGETNQFDIATTATRRLFVEGAVPLSGVFDESLWYLEVTNRNGIYNNVTHHLILRNLQIRIISNDGGGYIGWKTTNANQTASDIDNRVENVIVECTGANKGGSLGCNPKPAPSGTISNSSVNNALHYGFNQGFVIEDTSCRIANSYAVDCEAIGILANGVTVLAENCGAFHTSNGSDWSGTFHANSSHNASTDGSHPATNGQTGAPAFVRRGQRNYLHTSADTVVRNNGATDPLGLSYTTDIRGFTRSTWDIGPFESVAGSSALTGTATASITETDIVNGNKTLIDTLTNDTFVPSVLYPEFGFATAKGTSAGAGRTGDGNLTVPFPATAAAGMFAVMWVYNDQGDASTPTDWTEITGSPFGAGTDKLCVFTKTLVGGESNPVTTISGSAANISHCGNMLLFFNGQLGAIGAASNGTGTPMTAGAITTTAAKSIVVGLCGRGDNENASAQSFGGSATGVTEYTDSGTAQGDDSQCSSYGKRIDAIGSSGNGSATTSITDPWISVLIEIKAVTPFADARAAAATNIDSAQSEGTGFDALRSTILPVTAFVRTSSRVRTTTLAAAGSYDITAQETVTDTIPASMLNGGVAIAASPQFTIDVSGGGGGGATTPGWFGGGWW